MTLNTLVRHRLFNQRIATPTFTTPADVVEWLGAVQAQDYLGALWGVGLRMNDATESTIEQALADRTILRTWPMRGTLHFVPAVDARWMLRLMTPRILSGNAKRLERQFEIDKKVIHKSRDVITKALQGEKQVQRNALYAMMEETGIAASGARGLHILWWLAQEGLICFGAREGKQQTFALLDEWVPAARNLERDESLAELARRYFTSRGPATLKDFVWWSGLRATDARTAVELASDGLVKETIEGETYWLSSSVDIPAKPLSSAYLLPGFDEYIVAYKDRSAVLEQEHAAQTNSGNGILSPVIVLDGRVAGTWKRTVDKERVTVVLNSFARLKKSEQSAVELAAGEYGEFLGLPAVVQR